MRTLCEVVAEAVEAEPSNLILDLWASKSYSGSARGPIAPHSICLHFSPRPPRIFADSASSKSKKSEQFTQQTSEDCARRTRNIKWCRKLRPKVRISPWDLVHSSDSRIGPSQAETLLRVTSGIAAELVKAHDANQTVSLNELRAKISKKHGFGGVPRLVDIISAIPDDYKKALLPKLRARPIRTASGVGCCAKSDDRSLMGV